MLRAKHATRSPFAQRGSLPEWQDNIAAYRENTAKLQESGRAALEKQGVKFVDVPQPDLDATRTELVKVQDKAVEEAHISPKLIELVMADVRA